MAESQIPARALPRRWEWATLIAILIAAVVLRLWQLDSVPPGLTHDEASNGHDAAAVLQGVRPIYFTVGYGHEPLYPYSVALMMALLGKTMIALRLTTVAWGITLILLSYGFARRLFGSLPALLTAAGMSVSFWCVMTSRVGLRAITCAVTFTASAFCFWRAFPSYSPICDTRHATRDTQYAARNWLWWSLSGVFLGTSIYTYMASRVMPAVYLLFFLYLVFALRLHCVQLKRHLVVAAIVLLVAALVAAPLIRFLITHPGAEQRIGQLSVPLEKATQGDFRPLWRQIARSVPMFTFRGDPLWLYNIPERPLLDVPTGGLFYAGLLLCLWRWRDPRCAFLLIWLIVGVGPALVTGPDATVLRSIVAQPPVFIIAALALTAILQFLRQRSGRWGYIAAVVGVVALMMATVVRTAHAYFDIWAEHRDVRVAYHHTLVRQARYLDAQPEDGTVALSSIYPGRFHDPYTMEISLRREDLDLRWFNGRFALIFPSTGRSRVVIPAIASIDETLKPVFEEHASLIHTEHLRSDDLIPRFDVYRFDADGALAELLPAVTDAPVYWCPADRFPVERPQSAYETLNLPVNVGDVVELLGYDLRTPAVKPGGKVELLTLWRVRDSSTGKAKLFSHALDHDGNVIGQVDRLDVPSWHWRPGDVFVQLHRFRVASDAASGPHPLEVGLYTEDLGGRRWPVLVNGVEVDDRVLLASLQITSQ